MYRPWNSPPGDVLVVDWGHVGRVRTAVGERPLYAFCAVLGWSRYRFVQFTTSQKFPALAGCLVTCFEHLGGVPARMMFDNPKTVTTSFVAGQSVFNRDLVRLAAHYSFSPVTAAAATRSPRARWRPLVRYVKSDCVPAEGFASLDAASCWGRQWMDEANRAVHPETQAVPQVRLEVERTLLRPLRERPWWPAASGAGRTSAPPFGWPAPGTRSPPTWSASGWRSKWPATRSGSTTTAPRSLCTNSKRRVARPSTRGQGTHGG